MLMKLRQGMRRTENQKGFTLVELMVVVVILGILVAIAVPIYSNVAKKAADQAHDANVRILKGAGAAYITVEGLPSTALTVETQLDEFLETKLANMKVPKESTAFSGTGTYSVTIATDGKVNVTPDYVAASGTTP